MAVGRTCPHTTRYGGRLTATRRRAARPRTPVLGSCTTTAQGRGRIVAAHEPRVHVSTPTPTPPRVRLRHRVRARMRRVRFQGSAHYWEARYAAGGKSGAGSYGEIAAYKAGVLNELITRHQISSVIEFGSGDGNQLTLANYPTYLGLDVSRTAISMCAEKFAGDETKSFMWYDPKHFVNHGAIRADAALSLDVLLHLIEDAVFEQYLRQLFSAATRYVIIFSSDTDARTASHVRHRRFTTWVQANVAGWQLTDRIENPLARQASTDTLADFYVYQPDPTPGS